MTTPTVVPAGWYADPAHRHEYRYWGGAGWTDLVSDNSVTSTDQIESDQIESPLAAQHPAEPATPTVPPGPPAPVVTPQPPSYGVAPQSPSYGVAPQSPSYGVPAPAYGQPGPGFDPRLSAAMAEYSKRRYQILTGMGGIVTMERKATRFNWLLAVFLFILFGVGVILYAGIWAIWGVHRSYRVALSVGPQGEVQEAGDVLAIFDQDRLRAHRKRCLGFGYTFAIAAGIWAIATVGTTVTAHTDKLAIGLVNGILTILVAVGAYLLFRAARTTAQKLGMRASGR